MPAAAFTVLYHLPSGWWSAGTFATHAVAAAVAATEQLRTGWVHRVVPL